MEAILNPELLMPPNNNDIRVTQIELQLARMEESQRLRHDENQAWLKAIKVQTTLTNGRVRGLEQWRATIMGGIGVLAIAVPSFLAWLFTHYFSVK